METKLGNIFEGDSIVVAQSPHGVAQGSQSMDLYSNRGYTLCAPINGRIQGTYEQGEHRGGFHLVFGGYDILFHHCRAFKTGNVTRGEAIGSYLFKDGKLHVHTAIRVNGKWDLLLNYVDRKIRLLPEKGGAVTKWTDWNTYPNKYITLSGGDEMGVNIVYEVALKKGWNIRSLPNTGAASKVLHTTGVGEVWHSRYQTKGQAVTANGWTSDDWIEVWKDGKAFGYVNYHAVAAINPAVPDAALLAENKVLKTDMSAIRKVTDKWNK